MLRQFAFLFYKASPRFRKTLRTLFRRTEPTNSDNGEEKKAKTYGNV